MYVMFYYVILYCIILYCIALYCIVLYCIVLQCIDTYVLWEFWGCWVGSILRGKSQITDSFSCMFFCSRFCVICGSVD